MASSRLSDSMVDGVFAGARRAQQRQHPQEEPWRHQTPRAPPRRPHGREETFGPAAEMATADHKRHGLLVAAIHPVIGPCPVPLLSSCAVPAVSGSAPILRRGTSRATQ